jgi:hypothetical protein
MNIGIVHSQQPGVDCAPVQGQGWSGCAPINPSQQSTQGQQPQVPQRPPERWQDHWGAIATDGSGGSFGAATNTSSRSSAENMALADCQSKKGSPNCQVELWYTNQCAAMVVGDNGHNAKSGATPNEATRAAMEVCSAADAHCFVYYSACSLPVRIQ